VAKTLAGTQLTEAHRIAQLNITREALRDTLAVWPLLDPRELDATFPRYAEVMTTLLASHKQRSAFLAAEYIRAFRRAEGLTSDVDVKILDDLARRQALTTLLVTGPITTKVATRDGLPPEEAAQKALEATLGEVTRIVLQGGRDTIIETVREDREAIGWARITDADPCAFCAMLASRGAVYKEDTVGFEAHRNCGCSVEPVYDPDHLLPEQSKKWEQLWKDSTEGHKGQDAINAFRRAVYAQRKSAQSAE